MKTWDRGVLILAIQDVLRPTGWPIVHADASAVGQILLILRTDGKPGNIEQDMLSGVPR